MTPCPITSILNQPMIFGLTTVLANRNAPLIQYSVLAMPQGEGEETSSDIKMDLGRGPLLRKFFILEFSNGAF